ncbi:hypothetical protein BQ8794_210114 [Mesorhizobium prunaredense]|uniref:Uncharacterized protein n=1 Tax=Mesorhizobium prunaredense TaxID=1631249 RepID=A0A1R3V6D9_9HYPH|nr:hypothetical protein [Mesorhizobium prunaredense]SIT55421.1 hypothetical protein BQ8794_210114 [Mesorhizobium prunaredense]
MRNEISLDHIDRQLQRVLAELAALRERLASQSPDPAYVQPAELCTIDEFVMGMLGFRSRVSYYNHINQPGWPQRIVVGGKRPMLKRADGEAYVKAQADLANPMPAGQPKLLRQKPSKKRRVGRPVKAPVRGGT